MTLPSTSAQNQQQQQSQHFLLKWNNHRTNLVNVFEHLLQHENLVDVTLAVEGKFLKAHKIVLSACSPYFQTMFVQQAPEDKHPILIFHDLKHAHMKTLLEFMYRGEISIDERDLSDVLKIAEALSIRGLSSFESDEEDSMSDASPGSPQSNVNVTVPTASGSGTSSSNANSSNATSTSFQQQQDYYHASQSSASTNTSSSNISQSQLGTDNQNSQHQSKVGGGGGGGKATSSCDSKSTSGSIVNGSKGQLNARNIKKEKVGKRQVGSSSASAATACSVGSSATAASFSSIVSGLIMNKAANSNNIGKSSQSQSQSQQSLAEVPVKKKRGRKPLNRNKPDEKNGISTSVNSAAVAASAKDAAGSKSPKLKSQQTRTTAIQPQIQIPPRAAISAVKLKPVRRRIPKRLAETLQHRSQIKRERLAAGDLKNSDDLDDDFNGSLDSLTSSEPLSEMSVRGLDLFKYAAIEDGVYRCMECEKLQIPKTFKNKYSFQRHAFLYHEGNMRKVFPCPVCLREFSRPDKMKNHLRSVHEGGGSGNGGGGGGGGKSASSPTPGDFAGSSAFGLGPRMNEHCDF